jgi:hypothetical protein
MHKRRARHFFAGLRAVWPYVALEVLLPGGTLLALLLWLSQRLSGASRGGAYQRTPKLPVLTTVVAQPARAWQDAPCPRSPRAAKPACMLPADPAMCECTLSQGLACRAEVVPVHG